ncbi:MAG: DUF3828 domain-containing protein [Xanthobacteraceae bacterium]
MLTRRILLLCAASLCVSSVAVAGTARADDAAALAFVKAIYDSYTKPHSDGVLIDNGKKLRRYFEPTLAAAMNSDQQDAARHGDVGKLDGDPFIDAQDWEIKSFDVAMKDIAPGKASATVTFTNLGTPKTIVLDLVTIKNDWRIYDITWLRDGKPSTLRELFGLKHAA